MRIFFQHTKAKPRLQAYDRVKKIFTIFFTKTEMELTVREWDGDKRFHSMQDFPATLSEFSRLGQIQSDNERNYDLYLRVDLNYTPQETMRKNKELRDSQAETQVTFHLFHITSKFTMEAGYLLYFHPRVTHLAARTAQIEDYIAL